MLFVNTGIDPTGKFKFLAVGMIYPLMNLRESIVKNQIGAVYRTESSMSLEPLADPSDGEIPDDFIMRHLTHRFLLC